MAALCHDIGHLPFSHAAEKALLPKGWNHERLTRRLILSPEMTDLLSQMTPPLRPLQVVKLAIGPKKAKDLPFSSWESILAEIIVGDAFGVDRHGLPAPRFSPRGCCLRQIRSLPLDRHPANLPAPPADKAENEHRVEEEGESKKLPHGTARANKKAPMGKPALGVEEGGVHSAEALMLARYFMYSQLYFHPVRRIYDIHLKDFLLEWLEGGRFSTNVAKHLEVTDNEVTAAFLKAARDADLAGHDAARRIVFHQHFHLLYRRHPDDVAVNPEAGQAISLAASEKFGKERVRWDRYASEGDCGGLPLADQRWENSFIHRDLRHPGKTARPFNRFCVRGPDHSEGIAGVAPRQSRGVDQTQGGN